MAQRDQWDPLAPAVTGPTRVEGENVIYTRVADKSAAAACADPEDPGVKIKIIKPNGPWCELGATLIAGLRGRPDPGPKSGTFGTG